MNLQHGTFKQPSALFEYRLIWWIGWLGEETSDYWI